MSQFGWIDFSLLVVVIGVAAASYAVMRRKSCGPTGFWVAAFVSLFASGALGFLRIEYPSTQSTQIPGYALGTFYPALLFAGALAFSQRRAPAWLFPLALLLGAARGSFSLAGQPDVAQAIAAVVEPGFALAGAYLMYRATRGPGFSLLARALAPGFVGIAVLELMSGMLSSPGAPLPNEILLANALAVPLLLAAQISVTSARTREALEERVAERTSELAQSVATLEHEIAERRAAEEALRRSEERYRTVSELSSDYSFSFRTRGQELVEVEWVTDAVRRITGYTGEDLQGDRWMSVVHPDDRERVTRSFANVLAGSAKDLIMRIVTRSGEMRWVSVRFGEYRLSEDGTAHVVGAARDITERVTAAESQHKLEQHVAEVQRLESLGVLAGGIAHDFNNVLAVILGNSRLAQKELPEDAPTHERLARIQAAAEYASGLTEQMLTYSGKVSVQPQAIDLSQLTRDMLDLLRASISEKTHLDVDLAVDAPAIEGDPTQTRQILHNLVANASQALGEEGGRIQIRVGVDTVDREALAGSFSTPELSPGEYVALEVRDTGPGMPSDVQAHVFEPFFTTRKAGRGLGLAAVLGIVVAQRGAILLESARGEGTSFRILFPPSWRTAEATSFPSTAGTRPRADGTVLVVDDDEWVLEVAREFLARAGFRVETALGGQAGIDLVRERAAEIDVVVLDLVMPDVSGEDAFLAMREIRGDLPVVIASGYDKESTASRFSQQGIAGVLYKPYEPEEIVALVRAALGS